MNLAAAGTTFLIVLPAELPDKTVLACLVMVALAGASIVTALS